MFGVQPITTELLDRFEKITKHKPHIWLRRGLVFAHRDFDQILDDYEKGNPIYIYTGRGPSSQSMHIGHLVPFMFTKWLQDVFNAVVVIQIADDASYDIEGAMLEKLDYNKNRADHKRENRAQKHGKKF